MATAGNRHKNKNLEKRGEVWHFQKKVHGKLIKFSLETTSVTEARRKRDEYLKEILAFGEVQKHIPRTDVLLFGEVVKMWVKKEMPKRRKISTTRDYRSSLNKHILPRFGNTPIDDMNINDVENFIDDLELDLSPRGSIISLYP
ncbi:MAG: hypothetical protein KAR13_07705 [Desulfobulbaceae bacterium]|nr:hypothetical protein [Desulfobulbaceae bacterium]